MRQRNIGAGRRYFSVAMQGSVRAELVEALSFFSSCTPDKQGEPSSTLLTTGFDRLKAN
jgi:hypothetical protein